MRIVKTVLAWIVFTLFILFALVNIPNVTSAFLLIGAILLFPYPKWQDKIKQIVVKRWAQNTIIAALFIAAVATSPSHSTPASLPVSGTGAAVTSVMVTDVTHVPISKTSTVATSPEITTFPQTVPVTTTVPITDPPITTAATTVTEPPVTTAPPPITTKEPPITALPIEDAQKHSRTVYITRTGEKYHENGCRYLRQSKIAVNLDDAKAQGYTACSVCH